MLGIDPDDYGIAYKEELDLTQTISDRYRVYPNPTSDLVNIDLFDTEFTEQTKILVLDLTGRILLQSKPQAGSRSVRIETNSLNNGVYVLHVLNGEETIVAEQIIINK